MNTFADWHCDTASYICGKNMGFKDSDGHINIDMLEKYESPVQTFAVWLPKEYYKNAFYTTKMVIEYFKNEISLNSDKIALVKSYNDIQENN